MSQKAPTPADFTVSQDCDVQNRVRISSTLDPLSLQDRSTRKRLFAEALKSSLAAATDRVFTGDVKVEIIWFIAQERRYNTHIVADIDNIVKPLFDAVTGPCGVMIDDNQVQQFAVSWMDSPPEGLAFTMEIMGTSTDQFIERAGLEFYDFGSLGCFPIPATKPYVRDAVLQAVSRQVHSWETLMDRGIEPYVAAMVLPNQRFFPRARLGKYRVNALPEQARTAAAEALLPNPGTNVTEHLNSPQ